MKKKHPAFLLLDSMLGFFLMLQAVAIIPLCIVPTQKNLIQNQQHALLKLALLQKMKHPEITDITLKNQNYIIKHQGAKFEVFNQKQGLEYDSQQKKIRFFAQ